MRNPFFKKTGFNLSFQEHIHNPEKKATFTDQLFSVVAPVYNFFILGVMSFFQDRHWKSYLVEHLPPIPDGPVIDLATGTGKLAFLLAKQYPGRKITGIDINEPMLAIARRDNSFSHVTFEKVNIGAMPYKNNAIALFTGGYALRNAPDVKKLIADVYQQLQPNGVAAFLDFSKSPNRFIQSVSLACLTIWCTLFSLVLHKNRRIYTYIPRSLRLFPDRKALGELFTRHGFSIVKRKSFLFGFTEVIIVKK